MFVSYIKLIASGNPRGIFEVALVWGSVKGLNAMILEFDSGTGSGPVVLQMQMDMHSIHTEDPDFNNAILWWWTMGCVEIKCFRRCEIVMLMSVNLGECEKLERNDKANSQMLI